MLKMTGLCERIHPDRIQLTPDRRYAEIQTIKKETPAMTPSIALASLHNSHRTEPSPEASPAAANPHQRRPADPGSRTGWPIRSVSLRPLTDIGTGITTGGCARSMFCGVPDIWLSLDKACRILRHVSQHHIAYKRGRHTAESLKDHWKQPYSESYGPSDWDGCCQHR